ncbi:hypothetical protein HA402_014164 [Bradysia odoriphaga]|nr:hypothetical protein HA402_014164 [Bradysia odoriphaga]
MKRSSPYINFVAVEIDDIVAFQKLAGGSITKHFRNEELMYCYNDTSEPRPQHSQFTTKTTYELVKGDLPEPGSCDPVKIWLLTRHGPVYPSTVNMGVDIDALTNLKGSILAEATPAHPSLCDDDIELLKTWKLNENITQDSDSLTEQGRTRMIALAEEYKKAFAPLFDSPEKVKFRHTTELRNNESFLAFATALFNEDDLEKDADNNSLFKFYEECTEWNEKNDRIYESESVLSQFEKSDKFKETIDEILARLGKSQSEDKWKLVKNVWDMCRIDKALDVEHLSPWCTAFTEDQVNVLEYHEDIELYYKTGHGDKLNPPLACKTVVDLIDHLKSESTDDSTNAIVSFADATTVQLFMTALGTHEDTENPSNVSVIENRKWRSSQMSPFASNVAVVKYDCSGDDKVKIFLNQRLLTPVWDGCTDGVCEFSKFIEHFKSYTSVNCTDYFCGGSETSGKEKSLIGGGVLAATVSLILTYLL